jgi:hypothetical protein
LGNGRLILLQQIALGTFGDIFIALGPGDPHDLKAACLAEDYPLEKVTRLYVVKKIKRGTHYREASIHRMVSGLPSVVTLHAVIEEADDPKDPMGTNRTSFLVLVQSSVLSTCRVA